MLRIKTVVAISIALFLTVPAGLLLANLSFPSPITQPTTPTKKPVADKVAEPLKPVFARARVIIISEGCPWGPPTRELTDEMLSTSSKLKSAFESMDRLFSSLPPCQKERVGGPPREVMHEVNPSLEELKVIKTLLNPTPDGIIKEDQAGWRHYYLECMFRGRRYNIGIYEEWVMP
jgi:hypothetical protein